MGDKLTSHIESDSEIAIRLLNPSYRMERFLDKGSVDYERVRRECNALGSPLLAEAREANFRYFTRGRTEVSFK